MAGPAMAEGGAVLEGFSPSCDRWRRHAGYRLFADATAP
uniref:Predicted protein n=1 Tax=Hordeum vulgare subsp. vulgare TaxID=112509 RepID=F2D3J0_HORVV|nr:predicted protein [Hordeum vulgare subsp. vulgare]